LELTIITIATRLHELEKANFEPQFDEGFASTGTWRAFAGETGLPGRKYERTVSTR
jgi:hypothetical protein